MSAIPKQRTLAFWERWSQAILAALASRSIIIDEIAAHSFGCMVAVMMKCTDRPVTLLMPVPRPTRTYSTYGSVMYMLRHLIAPWYGWYYPAVWRGLALAHSRNLQTLTTIRWISRYTRYSSRQFSYQAALMRDMDTLSVFHTIPDSVAVNVRIVIGSHDTFSTEDFFEIRRVIPLAHTLMVPGGHMVPIESPQPLARELYGA